MDRVIERIAKAPVGAKVGVVAATVLVVTAVNYFLVAIPSFGASVSQTERSIARVEADQRRLDGDLIEKTAIANNLNQFRREKELLERRLAEALSELPEEKKLDELLQLFQDRATKAGIDIVSIEPQGIQSEGFYARVPIPMAVTGSFHEIATFFDALGRLRRIVNINNIVLDGAKDVNGRIILNARFLATTFMFLDSSKAGAQRAKGSR